MEKKTSLKCQSGELQRYCLQNISQPVIKQQGLPVMDREKGTLTPDILETWD